MKHTHYLYYSSDVFVLVNHCLKYKVNFLTEYTLPNTPFNDRNTTYVQIKYILEKETFKLLTSKKKTFNSHRINFSELHSLSQLLGDFSHSVNLW